jgi:hypothetical protein
MTRTTHQRPQRPPAFLAGTIPGGLQPPRLPGPLTDNIPFLLEQPRRIDRGRRPTPTPDSEPRSPRVMGILIPPRDPQQDKGFDSWK